MARHNDGERENWVMNDLGLYAWWKREMGGKKLREFVRAHRQEIDDVIDGALGWKPKYPFGYMQGRGAS